MSVANDSPIDALLPLFDEPAPVPTQVARVLEVPVQAPLDADGALCTDLRVLSEELATLQDELDSLAAEAVELDLDPAIPAALEALATGLFPGRTAPRAAQPSDSRCSKRSSRRPPILRAPPPCLTLKGVSAMNLILTLSALGLVTGGAAVVATQASVHERPPRNRHSPPARRPAPGAQSSPVAAPSQSDPVSARKPP